MLNGQDRHCPPSPSKKQTDMSRKSTHLDPRRDPHLGDDNQPPDDDRFDEPSLPLPRAADPPRLEAQHRAASSKTSSRPSCVRAEHSKYLYAPIAFAFDSPCAVLIGLFPCRSKARSTSGLARLSSPSPTRRNGVLGISCWISVDQLASTLLKDDGSVRLKSTMNTSVSGYDSFRSVRCSSCPAVSLRDCRSDDTRMQKSCAVVWVNY